MLTPINGISGGRNYSSTEEPEQLDVSINEEEEQPQDQPASNGRNYSSTMMGEVKMARPASRGLAARKAVPEKLDAPSFEESEETHGNITRVKGG